MLRPLAYIAEVRATGAIAAKIGAKHGVTVDEVKEAVVLTAVVRSGWQDHPVYGLRLLVVGQTYAGRTLNVVLYPVDEDEGIWALGTAMPSG